MKPTTDDPLTPSITGTHTPLAPFPSLPMCSAGQAAWEDDGTLQWELRLSQPVEVAGSVGVAVEG